VSLSNNYYLSLENIPESELDYGTRIWSGNFVDVHRLEYSISQFYLKLFTVIVNVTFVDICMNIGGLHTFKTIKRRNRDIGKK
jgi:hypothetical protein